MGEAVSVKTRVLLAVVAVAAVAVVVPEVGTKIGDEFKKLIGGVELVGDGETQFMVAASAASQVHKCTPDRSLSQQACDDLKFMIFDARKMPYITRNISSAWKSGKPGVLTKDSAAEPQNRKLVCLPSFPRLHGGECDEYPFASTSEGGKGAQEQEVPGRENRCQGGTIRARYATAGIKDGDSYLVVIIHPEAIALGPYQGDDDAISKDEVCG